jgi:hypothetical protein
MMMDVEDFVARLARNAEAVRSMVQGTPEAQARWKPSPEEWSVLEVVNHLYDEEREDFRQRLDLLLHRPGEAWPGIAPQAWVVERRYNEREVAESLENFLTERRRSVAWLAGLSEPDWEVYQEHPRAGRISAGDLLASWLVHDFLHLRQLAGLHWAYVSLLARPYATEYAGEW